MAVAQRLGLRSVAQESPAMLPLAILLFLQLTLPQTSAQRIPEDARLNFTGLASKYGFKCETHTVVTEDGYIIQIFRIPGDATRPVFLMHGVLDSSDTFILRGNTSMVAALSRAGYDVWVGNKRGNRYARNHVKLDPNTDKEFWNFSFHEIALYDLSATIDYILNRTGQSKLSCVGHSQGNTVFYTLGSMRPEYNDKVKLMIAMAPVGYLYHLPVPAKYVVQSWPIISDVLAAIGQEEVFNDSSMEKNIIKTLCFNKDSYNICAKGIFLALAGYDPEEFEPEFVPVVAAHYPSGTSRKVGTHLLQLGLKKDFSQMDYGVRGNMAAYNSTRPPNYDLSKVTMKVAMMAAVKDGMCPLTDVRTLRKRLPNVVDFHVMERIQFNHIDYIWGRNMNKHVFPKVMSLLDQYSDS